MVWQVALVPSRRLVDGGDVLEAVGSGDPVGVGVGCQVVGLGGSRQGVCFLWKSVIETCSVSRRTCK